MALALTANSEDLQDRQQQEDAARQSGMTGAEIDLARRGSSFDALTSFAMALAIAARFTDPALIAATRDKAVKAGISPEVCAAIEAFAIKSFDPIA
ncbi:hypothetical protein RPMA_04480 [Tardiphaga alba]|uniref:Uncharacterized protein n=1 Tax=Tardiphaga alba TaxID=340268 RepID=A0ABX8AER8_9BRAD|nr:hypothetical protein RPMA_04480 [Tardiphaga alba]